MKLLTLMFLFFFPLSLLANTIANTSYDKPFEDAQLEQRARSLFQEIRCAVCAGESIDESQSLLAETLRSFVRKSIHNGNSDEAIKLQLKSSYGDDILLNPPFQLNTILLWIFPFLLFLIGIIAIYFWLRSLNAASK